MDYGVVSTGFSRKPLAIILAEIQAQLITEFGPEVIQTPQSPLGQINGLMANLITQLWEQAEDVYQSFDVDQAEGTRLDTLAQLRLLSRGFGETELEFRQAITNQGAARVDLQDIVRAVRGIDGVTYAQVFLNDGTEPDENRLPGGYIAIAVRGGDDAELAATIRRFVVPGISTYGNTYVSTDVDGFCRTITLLRPILVPIELTVNIRVSKDVFGCPPPALTAIRSTLLAGFAAQTINGQDITHYQIRGILERAYPNVEVVSISGSRDGLADLFEIEIGFIEIATLEDADLTVNVL